ncbi:MAG: hypothetical protein MK185_10500 [Saccharospirillaceae bacterium]|jgi:hypothetical protein|nr:hypothetical protein [Saccharospirillaceae bacterium]
MKKYVLSLGLFFSSIANASTTDCQNLHIGRIWVEKGTGLKAVVYLNNRGDTSGSYWSYFKDWSLDERKEALSMLMAAKASNHRVNVITENTDGCGLIAGGTQTKALFLTTNP